MKNYIKKADLLTVARNQLNWVEELYLTTDYQRARNEGYGFIMGMSHARPDAFKELSELWQEYVCKWSLFHLDQVRKGEYTGRR